MPTECYFSPSVIAAAGVRSDDYARTRIHLEGAPARLSPDHTLSFLSVSGAIRIVTRLYPIGAQYKLILECSWRKYYRHLRPSEQTEPSKLLTAVRPVHSDPEPRNKRYLRRQTQAQTPETLFRSVESRGDSF